MKELIYVKLPQNFREELDLMLALDSDFMSDAERLRLFKPITVKVVMAIRSDRMSQLNAISDYLPNILNVYFELKPLDRTRALEAVTEPATAEGSFISPKFTYDDELLKRILDYLTDNNRKPIETFQLQMICQLAENLVIQNSKNHVLATKTETLCVSNYDIGELKNIFAEHYKNVINQFPEGKARLDISAFIEDKLIIDGSRMSLPDKAVLKESGITLEVLKVLIDNRILRSEPNSVDGISYEISHDTLVAPILESRKVSKDREKEEEELRVKSEELRVEREKSIKERIERDKERKRQRIIIEIVSVAALISIGLAVFAFLQMQ